MPGRECYHCHQWVEAKDQKVHDCWTTTEEALTQDLSDDLRDAWERIRETAVAFGEQRVYASHKSIMFSRKNCYCFVRPKSAYLEVCFFLGKTIRDPRIQKSQPTSKVKVAHLVRVKHRDEVEAPLTDWLKEAFVSSEVLRNPAKKTKSQPRRKSPKSGRNART
jgi:Domain of unknown function (DUF5655)